ncbi:MAG: formyltransferase family protein [Gemmatimonadaceae bacterium]
MKLALLCATQRGLRCLQRIADSWPDAKLLVFSFREDPGEPPFLDAIRSFTESRGGTFVEARQVGAAAHARVWSEEAVDLLLAVSWRYVVPGAVHRSAKMGSFVFHDSLLPAYRGFSPTVWAIVNGELSTGATLFRMVDAVDAGDIVDQRRVPIGPDDSIAMVMEEVTRAYLDLLDANFPALATGAAQCRPQDDALATYTCRRTPEDNRIDWARPTTEIYNLVRAITRPYQGATTTLEGRPMIIWQAERATSERRYVSRVPGRVVDVLSGRGAEVLTGDGSILLRQVQVEDGPLLSADQILTSPSQTLGR